LRLITPILVATAVAGLTVASDPPDQAALEQKARSLVRTFAGQLKPALKEALTSGGPVAAIDVCASRAPMIAAQLSEASGWKVTRVSRRPRNINSAQPDAWEQQVLERFEARLAAGEAPPALNYGEVVGSDFRYMQAQAVEPLCLLCHGESLSPEVQAALSQHYPQDRATGYRLGELRGAFSLLKQINGGR